jgi:hypothetical protein
MRRVTGRGEHEPLDGGALAAHLADGSRRPLVVAPRCLDFGPIEGTSVPPAHRASPDSQRRVDRVVQVARALRSDREPVRLAQTRLRAAGADLLIAPTATTCERALDDIGFAYRAAALTAEAIEQTRAALLATARGPAAVVAEIDVDEEIDASRAFRLHVERIANAGAAALLLLRASWAAHVSPRRWASAVATATTHRLVPIVALDVDDADAIVDAVAAAAPGACVVAGFERAVQSRARAAGLAWHLATHDAGSTGAVATDARLLLRSE